MEHDVSNWRENRKKGLKDESASCHPRRAWRYPTPAPPAARSSRHPAPRARLKHCDKIYQEQRSATGKRPRLAASLEYVREGNTLVVTRLDRLARSRASFVAR
ncbi:MAG: recombinase family protein [Chloroflexales bacterium]|nr:recombinase family protein [Chloroflexales bacterium]